MLIIFLSSSYSHTLFNSATPFLPNGRPPGPFFGEEAPDAFDALTPTETTDATDPEENSKPKKAKPLIRPGKAQRQARSCKNQNRNRSRSQSPRSRRPSRRDDRSRSRSRSPRPNRAAKKDQNRKARDPCSACGGSNHSFTGCFLVQGIDKYWISDDAKESFKANMKKPNFKKRVEDYRDDHEAETLESKSDHKDHS